MSQNEIDLCMRAQAECKQMLITLGTFQEAHTNAEGHTQASLAMAQKYTRMLEHIDAACDGLFDIINT